MLKILFYISGNLTGGVAVMRPAETIDEISHRVKTRVVLGVTQIEGRTADILARLLETDPGLELESDLNNFIHQIIVRSLDGDMLDGFVNAEHLRRMVERLGPGATLIPL